MKEWILLVYMMGIDIVDDVFDDFDEMKVAGNIDNIYIVGFLGGVN